MHDLKILAVTSLYSLVQQGDSLYQISLGREHIRRIGSICPHAYASANSVMKMIQERREIHDPEGNRYVFPSKEIFEK